MFAYNYNYPINSVFQQGYSHPSLCQCINCWQTRVATAQAAQAAATTTTFPMHQSSLAINPLPMSQEYWNGAAYYISMPAAATTSYYPAPSLQQINNQPTTSVLPTPCMPMPPLYNTMPMPPPINANTKSINSCSSHSLNQFLSDSAYGSQSSILPIPPPATTTAAAAAGPGPVPLLQLSLAQENFLNNRQIKKCPPSPPAQISSKVPADPERKLILYKTVMCLNYLRSQNNYCPRKETCWFAHGEADLRRPQDNALYKTQLCKAFIETGQCPRGEVCYHAHSRTELRRKT